GPLHATSSLAFSSHGDHRDLHSFPTRRSSDLHQSVGRNWGWYCCSRRWPPPVRAMEAASPRPHRRGAATPSPRRRRVHLSPRIRSEEHTSELQSRENLVCRLLLEKKKRNLGQN